MRSCGNVFEKVRAFDLFGLEMGLTYKGDKEFKTRMGGLITLIIVLTLLVSGFLGIQRVLITPTYNQFISDDFMPFIANEFNSSTIDTSNQTLAAELITIDGDSKYTGVEYTIARI